MDRYSGRDADLDSAPKQKMTNVERLGIGNVFVRAAPAEAAPQADGGAAAHFSRVEVVPSRREVKRTAATVAMPPPPPATKPAPTSASGYQAPPWASQPPAGTRPRFLRPPPLLMALAVFGSAVTRGAAAGRLRTELQVSWSLTVTGAADRFPSGHVLCAGAALVALKDGAVVQTVALERPATVLGRRAAHCLRTFAHLCHAEYALDF